MSEPIFDPAYWRARLERAVDREQAQHAVWEGPQERWRRFADFHRTVLSEVLQPRDSILDVGCGWGRLVHLLPGWWKGEYLGVDLSPDFIEIAEASRVRNNRPNCRFLCCDIRDGLSQTFDWAVCVSVRHMVIGNAGGAEWQKIEAVMRKVAKQSLILEYDETTREVLR